VNILITRHDKIGDFVTSLPLYYAAKKSNPNAKIYALVSKINIDLAKQVDFIDEVILYDKNNFWKTLKTIKLAKIDISISAFIDTRLGFLLFLSRIRTRIAPATKLAQLFFNRTLKQKRSLVEKTEVMYNLDLVKMLSSEISLDYKIPLLKPKNTQEFRKENSLKSKRIVLFHPGYGGSSDGNLALKDYIKISQAVRVLQNVQIVWTFGPDDLDAKLEMQSLVSKSDLIYQPPTLLDFVHLIADSELMVSTSTGPMHLAGALDINTISFFGNNLFSSPRRWSTVNSPDKQYNFTIDEDLNLADIEKAVLKILC